MVDVGCGVFFFLLVQSLRREKIVRIFKLNTGQDDHAIMFLDDYLNQVGCICVISQYRMVEGQIFLGSTSNAVI
jgi:hypothetical protein